MKTNQLSKIVEKWKNYSNLEEQAKAKSSPLKCLHDHCTFWRDKNLKQIVKERLKENNNKFFDKMLKEEFKKNNQNLLNKIVKEELKKSKDKQKLLKKLKEIDEEGE